MIHAYYGDGKGKSTAAAGAALRAAGNRMRVMYVQFLKTENTGERLALQSIDGITLTSCPLELKFTYEMDDRERQQVSMMYRGIFERAVSITLSDRYDMIVLDEDRRGGLCHGVQEAQAPLRQRHSGAKRNRILIEN